LESPSLTHILQTPLADDQFKFFSWLWELYNITEDEYMDHCGLDALCFLRVFVWGYRICVLGSLNAIWLMPLYFTAEESSETASITSTIVMVTITNVPPGSTRFIATAVAANILFGYTMYLMKHEFEWFIEKRNKFLRKIIARNYAVYVRSIPLEYRSKAELEDFFQQCFPDNSTLEATFGIKAPVLAAKVAMRDAVLAKLEHAVAVQDTTGRTPMHKSSVLPTSPKVNSILTYADEVKVLNREITQAIEAIERRILTEGAARSGRYASTLNLQQSTDLSVNGENATQPLLRIEPQHQDAESVSAVSLSDFSRDDPALGPAQKPISSSRINPETQTGVTTSHGLTGVMTSRGLVAGNDLTLSERSTEPAQDLTLSERSKGRRLANMGLDAVKTSATKVISSAKTAAETAKTGALALLQAAQDGEHHEAAFVSFRKLSTVQAALQMIHSSTPFSMEVLDAPDPDDGAFLGWNAPFVLGFHLTLRS
jgi:Late exocytosis, associated with Golgi transport/Cytosolic domain of 10TM putative phosphate transporter